jgi:hypothetical protein
LPLVISCSWKWNCSLNGVISRMFLKFRNHRWPSYTQLHNVSSSGGSSSDRYTQPIA